MNNIIKKLKEYKEITLNLIKLSLPILGGNVSQILISFADNIIAGRYSTLALGAISVASAIVMTVTIGAIGLILSVSPVIANFRGQKIQTKKYFKLTILFSIIVSIPFFLILELLLKNINLIGLSPELVEPVSQYIQICAWTVFPAVIFVAIKEFLQAWEKVVYANFVMLVMVVLNVILNYVFTFGFDFGIFNVPAMGVVGISIATLVSRIISAILILLYCIPLFKTSFQYSKEYIKDLLKVGTPISCSIFFEFLGFNLTAVLIGKFSALYAAVHNIILCLANFTFMIVLSVSNAASIKIGYFNGKNDVLYIKRYSITNILLVIVACLMTFTLLFFYHNPIISMFSTDAEVMMWCEKILKIAMCFLFFDGIQGACVGVLKGLKDTKIIMITMLIGYLGIVIPLGSYIAYHSKYVLEGFWSALALGLFIISIITSTRVILDIKKLERKNGQQRLRI